jgi:hypothetical protein
MAVEPSDRSNRPASEVRRCRNLLASYQRGVITFEEYAYNFALTLAAPSTDAETRKSRPTREGSSACGLKERRLSGFWRRKRIILPLWQTRFHSKRLYFVACNIMPAPPFSLGN